MAGEEAVRECKEVVLRGRLTNGTIREREAAEGTLGVLARGTEEEVEETEAEVPVPEALEAS